MNERRRNESEERKRKGICFIGIQVRRRESSTVASIKLLPQLPNYYFLFKKFKNKIK